MSSPVEGPEFNLDAALAEAEHRLDEGSAESPTRLADEVLLDLAYRALEGNRDLQPASSGLGSMMGRRDGIKVTVDDRGDTPQVTIDAYLNVRYGVRIPDAAWDLQERMKRHLESVTGCQIKAVNIHVQGVMLPPDAERS